MIGPGFWVYGFLKDITPTVESLEFIKVGFKDSTTIMEKQMEEKFEHSMELDLCL